MLDAKIFEDRFNHHVNLVKTLNKIHHVIIPRGHIADSIIDLRSEMRHELISLKTNKENYYLNGHVVIFLIRTQSFGVFSLSLQNYSIRIFLISTINY